MTAYRLPHGSPLTDAEAAQLITRTAQGEALTFAPVKAGRAWVLLHLTALSALVSQRHPVPAVSKIPPQRAALSAANFPMLTECRPADPAQGTSTLWFIDDQGRAYTVSRGADTLSVKLASGDVLLIFIGSKGQTRFDLPTGTTGFQIPACLWPTVENTLSARQGQA